MPATRIRAAAVQALQLALLVLCLLPLWPLWWAIFSIFGVLTVARGLRNTDSYPGPHWLKWPLAVVSLPLKLAAGLAWTLYAFLTLTIHPFTLLAVEILRLCKRPTWGAGLVQVAPAEHGGQTRYIRFDSIWTALEGRQGLDDQDTTSVRPGDVRLLSAKWLMERAKKGEPLSRRQDLPEEAFLSAAQLKAIQAKARPCFHLDLVYSPLLLLGQGKGFLKHFGSVLAALLQLRNERNADSLLPIIAVSYCWLEAPHPDRDGQQLHRARHAARRAQYQLPTRRLTKQDKPTTTIATYATNEPQYATRSLLSRSRVDWAIEAAERAGSGPSQSVRSAKRASLRGSAGA
jgi:hypothetical protein